MKRVFESSAEQEADWTDLENCYTHKSLQSHGLQLRALSVLANKKLVSQGIFLCMTLTLICISQDSALLCALNGKF